MGLVEPSTNRQEVRRLQRLLRSVREEAGIRQVDLARALGVPQSYVSKYENGERRLDVVEARQVCRCLGTTLEGVLKRFDAAG